MNTSVTKTSPSLLSFSFSLLGPVVTVLSLRLINLLYDTPFKGPYMALAIITFLVSFIIFRELLVKNILRKGPFAIQLKNLLFSWLLLIGTLLFLGYAAKSSEIYSRLIIITWITLTPLVLMICFSLARYIVFNYFPPEKIGRKAVIVGINGLSNNLTAELRRDARLGISVVGYFDDRDARRLTIADDITLYGKLADLADFVKQHRIDIIYITLPMVQEKRIVQLLDALRDTTASIYFVPDLFIFDLINARIDEINGIPLLAICESPFSDIRGLLKRGSDILLASLIMVLIFPLCLIIAAAIAVESRGPVIFRQRRYGLDGEEIIVYKFRSMKVTEDASAHIRQATRDDSRITRVGAFLRRTSLDELPQFLNVLQGRMSIVGPRPHAVAHNELYRKLIKGYMIRHKVKPGITGWAQVNGLRGETESVDKMRARIEYDLEYLRHWTLYLDFLIILRTIALVFRDRNAY